MRVVIAPNSFKHCLSAGAVSEAIARGIRSAAPQTVIDIIPLSDGGDGLLDAVAARITGTRIVAKTLDPLGRPITAAWYCTSAFALIEMALASGLARLKGLEEYAPLQTSTRGTGLLIQDALDHGCQRLVIGLGGSATVDGGCGMAEALGFRLLDRDGHPIPEGGGGLARLDRIESTAADARLTQVRVIALTDVQNPLLGPSGAARLFAPQKGARPTEVEILEQNLAHWAAQVQRDLGQSVTTQPGAGAAGGLGAGCLAFLRARLTSGAQWVADQVGLRAAIQRADLVITGEGRLDQQTAFGKVPAYVARLAQALGKPVIALGGAVADGTDLAAIGIRMGVAITPPGQPLAEALEQAGKNLELAAARVMLEWCD